MLALLLSSLIALADETPILTLNPAPSVACNKILKNVEDALSPSIPDLVLGGPAVFQVGLYKDLRRLAIYSGMERSVANNALAFIDKALEPHKGKQTILGSTLKYLQKHRDNPRAVLICVLSEDCHLPVGTVFIPDESKIALGTVGSIRIRTHLNRPIPHLILMNGGDEPYALEGIREPAQMVAAAWAIDFVTAATSFADYELVIDWIEANEKLLIARQRSDELFDRYVRIVPRKKVDTGFYRAFSSSRSIAASLAVMPIPLEILIEHSMMEIRAAEIETKDVVAHFNLSEKNLLDFGERVNRMMVETIKRAEGI